MSALIAACLSLAVPGAAAADPKSDVDESTKTSGFSPKANWIWANSKNPEGWIIIRKRFQAPPAIKNARLLITAGFHYEAYLNGQVLACDLERSFNFDKSYCSIDISSFVNPGTENVIATLLPNFPFDGNGFLAEIVMTDPTGQVTTVSTDSSWQVGDHPSFQPGTPLAVGFTANLGREEVYDARKEPRGWQTAGFDDSACTGATVLGPVGTPPWTGMHQSILPLITRDPVLPQSIQAVELAESPRGYHFRLLTPGRVFLTEVNAPEGGKFRVLPMCDGGAITLNGRPQTVRSDIELTKGLNLLCCDFSAVGGGTDLLVETDANLSFSAQRILGTAGSAQWAAYYKPSTAIFYPWHMFPQQEKGLGTIARLDDITTDTRKYLLPAPVGEPSIAAQVKMQKFFKAPGGFVHPRIETATPRLPIPPQSTPPLINMQAMLHMNADACTVVPQPGKDVHILLDFEQEVLGRVNFSLDAPAGTIVDVHCFELLDPRGIVFMTDTPVNNDFRYTCREGRQQFTSQNRRGFRYLSMTLRNFSRPVKIESVACLKMTYPIQKVGDFECSDRLLTEVFRQCRDTVSLCMVDGYISDAAWEQNFWLGDMRIIALVNMLLFGGYDIDQQSIRLVAQSLTPNWVNKYFPKDERYQSGKYLTFAAYPTYPDGGLPIWSFMWVLQCWEHYLYTGDRQTLAENYGYVNQTLKQAHRITNERGLFDMPGAWNLIEWGNNDLSHYGEATANNLFMAECLRRAAAMAEALGLKDDTARHRAAMEQLIATINKHCWDPARNAYVDTVRDEWAYGKYVEYAKREGLQVEPLAQYLQRKRISEQTNTIALLFDCVPPERKKSVIEIVERVRKGHYIMGSPANCAPREPTQAEAPDGIVAIGSPFFLFFTLDALFQHGQQQLALEVMRRDWGAMIADGTKTCWETFKMNPNYWTRSICHGWSAAPAVYLPREVLGIKPLEPGYRRFKVEPFMGDLTWARGSVATPNGPIYVSWVRNQDGKTEITCHAPEGCERVP